MQRSVLRRRAVRALTTIAAVLATSSLVAGCSLGRSDDLTGMSAAHLAGGKGIFLPTYGQGKKAKLRELRASKGKLLLLYFGYLRCPDVCPTTMSALGVAVRSLEPEQRNKLEVAMVTADPARDSGKDIAEYLGHFFRDLPVYGVRTTDFAALARAEDAFGAASEIDKHKPGEQYAVSHTAFLYAVDGDGHVEVMWPFGALSEDISKDLRTILDRKTKQ
jgi:protein SCO1/2